ncbi:RNA-binding S4 domain-containing protein [Chitiniphilus shinanonensis]|nr:RNA-binding S4 domain-containing protein [Chitiniphilus shinanonensis]
MTWTTRRKRDMAALGMVESSSAAGVARPGEAETRSQQWRSTICAGSFPLEPLRRPAVRWTVRSVLHLHMSDDVKVRLDKWLWASRFFKTRSLATDAIDGGHVHLNGERAKPARSVRIGDLLRIQVPHGEFEVEVMALSDRRGGADIARTLYRETEQSAARREATTLERELAPQFDHPLSKGRPTKKWRRQLHQFDRKQFKD